MSPTAPPSPPAPEAAPGRPGAERLAVALWRSPWPRCLGAGLALAASVPPWGWWPLALVGVALWDRLLADRPWTSRFGRSWLVGVAWFAPSMLWMWDLTAPGYLVAVVFFAAYLGVAGALVPPAAPARWIALPAALVLCEAARASFPFGGVPLATVAMGQAAGPLGQGARLGTALLVAGVVGGAGVALSALGGRRLVAAGVAGGLVVAVTVAGVVAPAGHEVGRISFAIVQGGGDQGTRAGETDEREVFRRHLEASEQITGPVDLVVWPENVVAVQGLLAGSPQEAELSALARRLGATVVVGVTEKGPDRRLRNAAVAFLPDGAVGPRYDKVHRVPFGEYVPLRGLVERLGGRGSGMPSTDAVVGTAPAMLPTPAGDLAVAISWEVFFTDRVREGVQEGGQIVLNPTNGSSYWLTQVQGQQVASSRLRAIETGRWVLQAAPTGYSAVVEPGGGVVARSGVSETWVHQGTASLREGDTPATWMGPGAPIALAAGVVVVAQVLAVTGDRRRRRVDGT